MTREDLAERVFARIEKLKLEPHAANLFSVALILWDEDREALAGKISKGFNRAGVVHEEPARSTKHDIG